MKSKGTFSAICILMAIILIIPAMPAKAEEWVILSIEQCHAEMPLIDLYFYLQDCEGNLMQIGVEEITEVHASIGGRKLAIESIAPFSEGGSYFVILDISGSIQSRMFEQIKKGIVEWIDSLSPSDSLTLITMGERVTIALNGSETRETAKQTVASLKAKDKYTVFNESLVKAIELAENDTLQNGKRKAAIVITDGINKSDSVGGTSFSELANMLENAQLPLYALGVGNDTEALTALGELARTSGGLYRQTNLKKIVDDLSEINVYMNTCYHLKLRAEDNIISGQVETLSLKLVLKDGTVANGTMQIAVTDWIPDMEMPVASVVGGEENKTLKVTFSEPVYNAEKPQNYVLRGADGILIPITSVSYSDEKNIAELVIGKTLFNGSYTLEIHGVTDISMEKNPVSFKEGDIAAIQLTKGNDESRIESMIPEEEKSSLLWWIIGAAALVIMIIAGVIASSKKKKANEENKENEEKKDDGVSPRTSLYDDKIHLEAQQGEHVRLCLIDGNGVKRELSAFITDSIIIGRSTANCDISIEDRELSRQHCAIIYQDGTLMLQDLGSTNGTNLNGNRLYGIRPLSDGDTIEIGNTKIIVYIK